MPPTKNGILTKVSTQTKKLNNLLNREVTLPPFFKTKIIPERFDTWVPKYLIEKPIGKIRELIDPIPDKTMVKRIGPLLIGNELMDTKDPCPVYDGTQWHIFGSGGTKTTETWEILHALSPTLQGPWQLIKHSHLHDVEGEGLAAPGMVYDKREGLFHMFVQTDFRSLDTRVEHLISSDGGDNFFHAGTVLKSIPNTNEAGIYDPHPAIIKNSKGEAEFYLAYTGVPKISHGDIYLAKSKSRSWLGPWERLGPILKHEEVPHHNAHNHPDYEWGLEGAQLIQLPNGKIILNAVCFLPDGPRGTRQRIFLALADKVTGPYKTLGTILEPTQEQWESGENGHATALIYKGSFHLFYQARSKEADNFWRYGLATWDLRTIEKLQPYGSR